MQIEFLQLAEGFFQSRILFSLNELGIFRAIGSESRSLESLSSDCGVPGHRLIRLLRAGVSLGLLAVDHGGSYRLKPKWAPFLTDPEAETYLGNWLAFLRYVDSQLAGLSEVARGHERSVDDGETFDDRDLVLAMHDYAVFRGRELVDFLDVSGCKNVLDLGCGPGTFAYLLGARNPGLDLHLFDSPAVIAVAREVGSRYPFGERVHYLEGNAVEDEIPGTYDLILISNMLHMLGETSARALLSRLYGNVNPGGSIVVQAQFLHDDHRGPRWAIVVDLIQLCVTREGRNHTISETRNWMEEAGFRNIDLQPMSLLNTNSYLRGYRRGAAP